MAELQALRSVPRIRYAYSTIVGNDMQKGCKGVTPRVAEHGTHTSIYARHGEAQQANDCGTTPTAIICTAMQQQLQKATKMCLSWENLLQASIGSVIHAMMHVQLRQANKQSL
jgi:hypothetical protein